MAIVLNGTTGITAPDIDVTAQSTDIVTTGDVSAVDGTFSGGVYLGGTGSANYLDDYEEGTWTPTITGSSTAPTVGYSLQKGYYTKIGRQVHVVGLLLLTSISGGSGDVRIDSLPFTSANLDQLFSMGTIGQMQNFTTRLGDTDGQTIAVRQDENTTQLTIVESNETTSDNLLVSDIGSSFLCRFSVTYFTA